MKPYSAELAYPTECVILAERRASSVVELLFSITVIPGHSCQVPGRFELLAGFIGGKDGALASLSTSTQFWGGLAFGTLKTMFHLSDFAMVLSAGYTNIMESSMPSGCGLNNNPVARHAEFIRSSTNMLALHFQIG